MSYPFELDDQDESDTLLDGPRPADTIAGSQTPRDAVMERIRQVRTSSGDESSPDYSDPSNEAAMEFAKNSQMTAGIGTALNAIAAGTGYKPDNSLNEQIAKTGIDVANKDMSRRAQIAKTIETRKAQAARDAANAQERATDNDRAERVIGLREEENRLRRDALAAGKAQKLEDRDKTLAVPGYELTGQVLPKPEEAQKIRKAVANAEQLQTKLSRLRDLVEKNGPFEWSGETGAEMQSLATEIQLLAKGEDMYQLGVLTGPDLTMLQKITADPASISSLFTRGNTRLNQIDTQLKSIKGKLGSTIKASGYREVGSQPEFKTVNGKTYKKVQGGWAEVAGGNIPL